MMARGIRVRLIAFAVLAAVGVVYVAGSYLGLVDKVLGRGLTLHAALPDSGGLYVGSEVAYRGVKVGKVSKMQVTKTGVLVTMAVDQGTRIPKDSGFHVADLTAVGEQYLDFTPSSPQGPYAASGDTFHGTAADLPQTTGQLLIRLSRFVNSVNGGDLRTVVQELGTMFQGEADPLAHLLDSGSRLIATAKAHEGSTISLLDHGRNVLATQEAHSQDITNFARGLADLTQTLRVSDPQLRTILQGGTSAVREVNSLMVGLQPVLPVFIGNLVTVNQVVTARLPALEQTLVTFPLVVSNGFTGTPGDGYGHLNMQFDYRIPPCTKGYLQPPWPSPLDTRDLPLFPAKCRDPKAQPGYTGANPMNQRGVDMVPAIGAPTGTADRVAPYDARSGVSGPDGYRYRVNAQGGLDNVFGTNAWQWMLIGPVKSAG